MLNNDKEDKLERLINKHPNIATAAFTTSVLALLGFGYVFGEVKKPDFTRAVFIQSNIDDEKLVVNLNDDEYSIVKLHNNVTDQDNYIIASCTPKDAEGSYIHNVLDEKYNFGEKDYILSIDESADSKLDNVTYENLGNLYEYIITYNVKFEKDGNDKLIIEKEDLRELLKTVKSDIENKKAKELILKQK